MFNQYWIIVDLLELLVCACFEQNRHFRLQYLLYQIKLALLRSDNCSEAQMALLCPLSDLEKLRGLFHEALSYQGALAVQDRLEEQLTSIINHLEKWQVNGEGADPAAVTGRPRPQVSLAGTTPE